jgi:hypothetical protein
MLRPGWLILITQNATLSEVALFLRDDLKDLRLFLLKMILLFIDIKIQRKEAINHPGREVKLCKHMILNYPDHPSFKSRGNLIMQLLMHA